MNLGQRVLDSGLITQDNSAGIIEEATVKAVDLPDLPENVRVEGTETDLQTPAPLGEAVETLQSEPTSSALGNFGDPFESIAQQATLEQERLATTTYGDSVGASVKMWDVVGAYDQYQLEQKILDNEAGLYTPDIDFDIKTAISTADIPLSLEEVKWLNGKGITSNGAFNLYMENIQEKRDIANTASLAPVTSTVMGFVDPTYLVLGGLVGKGVQLARMGRFGTSVVVGASEYAMVEAQTYHRPVSNIERVIGAVLPSAITFGVYRNPRTHQQLNGIQEVGEDAVIGRANISEPSFDSTIGKSVIGKPNKATVDYVDNIDTVNASRNTPIVDNPDIIVPARQVDTDGTVKPYKTNEYGLPKADQMDWKEPNSRGVAHENTAYKWVYDILEDVKVPKSIRDSTARLLKQAGRQLAELEVKFNTKMRPQGRFNTTTNTIELKSIKGKRVNAQTLNHEIVHGLTSLRIMYGKAKPDSVHGHIVKDIEDLRGHVSKEYRANKDKYSKAEQKEIEYALQDTDEFLAGLYEGNTAFHRMMSEFETPANLRQGGEKTLLQSLYNGFRKLFGLTNEESRALNKALKLSEDLIDTPTIRYTDINGKERVFRASEVTPKLIEEVAEEEAKGIFESIAGKAGYGMAWNLKKTMAKASERFSNLVYSSPFQGDMGSNIVSSKRALSVRLGINRNNAEQMLSSELSNRGVSKMDRFLSTKKYRDEVTKLEAEVAYYIEQRSQAGKAGKTLPDEDTVVGSIAREYKKMTDEARDVGIRAGIFGEDLGDTTHYLPRKIDPNKYMEVLEKYKTAYGEEDAVNRLIDSIAKTLQFKGKDAEYARHIAYIYHKRMHDKYHYVGDNFRGHMGNEVIVEISKYLDELGVTDQLARKRIEELLTGAIDKRGEASFQKARLDIDTLGEQVLPTGETFRFFDLMDTGVLDSFSRYADNVSGRVALAEHGLGTPTLWAEAKEWVTGSPFLRNNPDLRNRYGKLVDDTYNDLLGYPVGNQLHPFLVATRAFTQSVSLKYSGIWQVMEAVPTLVRHAKANGISDTFKIAGSALFTSLRTLEKTKANDLVTILARASMDDLKVSPLTSRLADNHAIDSNTLASKMNHMSKYTHILNGMRYLMGKQSIMSAKLIVDLVEKAGKGNAKSIELLKKYGFNDTDLRVIKREMDLHGTDFNRWDMDVKGDTLPKLMNLMDTDVLRSRLGEIPAIMEFSQVGKVLGTFRNFILSAHNKILASQLRDEGILAVAMLTAYQLPVAMMSVQVASIARGDGIIEDPAELFHKAFMQLGGLGLIPEFAGILSGDTRGFGSPFMLGIDRIIGVGNAVGSLDPMRIASTTASVIPLASVTLGFQAGVDSILQTIKESMEE